VTETTLQWLTDNDYTPDNLDLQGNYGNTALMKAAREGHKEIVEELLESGADCLCKNVDGNQATTSVLSSVFLTEGVGVISGTRPCFINFTEELLLKKIPYSFPKNQIVVEILEDVKPTPQVVEALRELKKSGYTIALDDFEFDRRLEPLLAIADIVKIDVRLTPLDTIIKMLQRLKHHKIKLLAEKVETLEEFEKANKLGFKYYQGYFFSKPEKMLVKELASSNVTLFTLMAEIAKKKTTLERLHAIITKDLAISFKLLRFLNSAYFYRLEKIKNVKHAIAYLGEKELRRFLLLVVVSKLSMDKPAELVRLSLVRAKFCELMAKNSLLAEYDLEIFMVGLFSLMDTMLDAKMTTIMEKLPVSTQVKDALIHREGMYAPFLKAVVAYERKQDTIFLETIKELHIDSATIPDAYIQAIKYSNGML